jgi:hypothetical protein
VGHDLITAGREIAAELGQADAPAEAETAA